MAHAVRVSLPIQVLDNLEYMHDGLFVDFVEKRSGSQGNREISTEQKGLLLQFLGNFATVHGLPDPGRDSRLRSPSGDIILLQIPQCFKYKDIYSTYIKGLPLTVTASEQDGKCNVAMSFSRFRAYWAELRLNIRRLSPRSDVCSTCAGFRRCIITLAGAADEGSALKTQKGMALFSKHRDDASTARQFTRTARQFPHRF